MDGKIIAEFSVFIDDFWASWIANYLSKLATDNANPKV